MRKINRKRLPKFYLDKDGVEVPTESIREDHLKRHLVVEEIFAHAGRLSKRMVSNKKTIVGKISKYDKWLSEFKNVENAEFGNVTITSYDGLMQVVRTSPKVQDLDEGKELAKAKIAQCIKKWEKGSNENLVAVTKKLLKMDGNGNIGRSALIDFANWDIDDVDWREASVLIKDAMTYSNKKEYLMLRTRKSKNGKWKNVNLNFSTIGAEV